MDEDRAVRHLRLVWSRDRDGVPSGLRPARVNLALAIERHLDGRDGLTEREFLDHYVPRRTAPPRLVAR